MRASAPSTQRKITVAGRTCGQHNAEKQTDGETNRKADEAVKQSAHGNFAPMQIYHGRKAGQGTDESPAAVRDPGEHPERE